MSYHDTDLFSRPSPQHFGEKPSSLGCPLDC
jgi:hypothetical protein